MKIKHSSALIVSIIFLLSYVFGISASAEEKYKISYDKGLHNSYQGAEPDDFIKGEPPESFRVEAGGSFTVAQNTFTFRDYYFAGWSCTYTDASGSSVSKLFHPGDTVSNVRSDMVLKAVWAQSAKPLTISGFIYYCETDAQTVTRYDNTHYIGETVALGLPLTSPGDTYTFSGWLNKETGRIYKSGELFEIALISSTFAAIWEKDGVPVNFCTVTVHCTDGGHASFETQTVISGSEVTIELFPDDGYEIKSVTKNGNDIGSSKVIAFTATEKEEAINAVFVKAGKKTDPQATDPVTSATKEQPGTTRHTLIIYKESTGGADGRIYVNGVLFTAFAQPFYYADGETVSIAYEADKGCEVASFNSKNDGVAGYVNYVGRGNPFQITMNSSKTMTVKFKKASEEEKPLSGTPLFVLILFIVALSICVSALYIMIFNKKAKKRRKKKNKKRTPANTRRR